MVELKTVTKSVLIRGQEFVLVTGVMSDGVGEYKDKRFYGTVPYSEITEDGYIHRSLNGFDMCVDYTIADALKRREDNLIISEYRNEGHTEEEILQYVLDYYKTGAKVPELIKE